MNESSATSNNTSLAVGDILVIEQCEAGSIYSNTNAVIREIHPNGSLIVEPLVFNPIYMKNKISLTSRDAFQKARLKEYEVTACRTGSYRIMACTAEQAIDIVIKHVSTEQVDWCENWEVTDASSEDELVLL